jgi:hypothetical protein
VRSLARFKLDSNSGARTHRLVPLEVARERSARRSAGRGGSFGALLRDCGKARGSRRRSWPCGQGLSPKRCGTWSVARGSIILPHTLRSLADALGLSREERASLCGGADRGYHCPDISTLGPTGLPCPVLYPDRGAGAGSSGDKRTSALVAPRSGADANGIAGWAGHAWPPGVPDALARGTLPNGGWSSSLWPRLRDPRRGFRHRGSLGLREARAKYGWTPCDSTSARKRTLMVLDKTSSNVGRCRVAGLIARLARPRRARHQPGGP